MQMPADIFTLLPLSVSALEGALSVFWALSLIQTKPLERVRRALPLCVIWGALFAITPRTGWQLALIVPLFFLLGAAVWLLLRPPLLYAAAAAVLAALIAGTLELLQTVAGPFVVPAALVLAILFVLRQLAFAAVQRIEAIIDKQYQTELLNLMQIIQ